MPLIKSKSRKAFSHNVEAEMSAGKPQKQAVAIAYSVKRKAEHGFYTHYDSGSMRGSGIKGGINGPC